MIAGDYRIERPLNAAGGEPPPPMKATYHILLMGNKLQNYASGNSAHYIGKIHQNEKSQYGINLTEIKLSAGDWLQSIMRFIFLKRDQREIEDQMSFRNRFDFLFQPRRRDSR